MAARSTYAVAKDITERSEAERACLAVLDVLRPVLARAIVDAYTDYRAQMPADVAAAEQRLHGMGREQGHRDPGMGVQVVLDEDGWQLLRTYAPWSINIELLDGNGGGLGTLHDCGYSIIVELTEAEATALRARLDVVAPVVRLSELRPSGSRWWSTLVRRRGGSA